MPGLLVPHPPPAPFTAVTTMGLKICRVINAMWTGGVQVRLQQLLPRLKALGAEPEVCVIRTRGGIADRLQAEHGIPTTLVQVDGKLNPLQIRKLRDYFRQRRFDVVHTHMYHSNVPGTIGAWWAGTPCVVGQIHNVDSHDSASQRRSERFAMRFQDTTLCVSQAVRDDVVRQLHVPPDRLTVLVNGLDFSVQPARDRATVRAEFNIPDDAIVLIHVARLHEQKNHIGFLRAFPAILRDVPEARLLIVGKGEEEDRLRAEAARLHFADAVVFAGKRADVPALLAASDIAVLPSHKEGFSNAILEAMHYGPAVVATDVGGAREQLRDGADGFIVPPGDMDAFARRVLDLARDPALRGRISAAAKSSVQRFSIDVMARDTLALYDRILARRPRR